jgi:2-polyprenyl-3-methyl-5-hydroxy-6-metoxy-1,4-benzoquinol methylase
VDLLLRQRAVGAVETMDLPDCDPQALDNTYRQFEVVNRMLSGWRRLYVRELRPFLADSSGPGTLLDIGSGGGDLATLLAHWATRDHLDLHITGIDPDPRAAAFAERRAAVPGLNFRRAHSAELVSEGSQYDFVISNHVLHHLDAGQLQELFAHSQVLAGKAVFHNDLRRSPVAYALFSAAALPFRHSFIRADGLTSIRRSYTRPELEAIAPPGWVVRPGSAFHQVLAFSKD